MAFNNLLAGRAIGSIDGTQDGTTDSMTGTHLRSKMKKGHGIAPNKNESHGNDREQLIKGIENDAEREKAKALFLASFETFQSMSV